ncbi:MAG TPA: GNAT family N-acetyltransferase [Flavobacteriaceae bacterium]|nr:GNAT family N-acetyltransferase [Flavobacteriaceae bacterium]
MNKSKNYNVHIKCISAQETYKVRHPVLRENKPWEMCALEGDNKEDTLHLGLYCSSQLIGVATFLKNACKLFSDTEQYQLRGMAILQSHQGKGLGHLLLEKGEFLLQNKCTLIWCNAREKAVSFYKKHGYNILGESFEIEDIGIHYKMYKKIS